MINYDIWIKIAKATMIAIIIAVSFLAILSNDSNNYNNLITGLLLFWITICIAAFSIAIIKEARTNNMNSIESKKM